MKTHQPILTTSITATADLAHPLRLIGLDGDYCGAGERALGTLAVATDAGQQAPVNVLGVVLVESGAAVAAGAVVESDASGRAITRTTGVPAGVSLDDAAAAGSIVRIVRGIQ